MASNESPGLRPFGFFTLLLLLLAASLSTGTPQAPAPQHGPQVYDASRHILFAVNPVDGSIRVLNLFHNVAQIGSLRSPGRHAVHELRLVPGGHSLWVLADDGIYRYDTHSLRQTAFQHLNATAGLHFGCVAENTYVLRTPSNQSAPGA